MPRRTAPFPRPISLPLLLLLLLSFFAQPALGGFWSGGGDADATAAGTAEAEVGARGDIVKASIGASDGDKKDKPKCKPVLRELPGKYLGPLGDQSVSQSNGASSMIVFIATPGSAWWCGAASSLTASAKKNGALRARYAAGVYLASAKSKGVRAAFGITGKSQVPAVAVVEISTGRRYVLRGGEAPSELPSQDDGGLSAASVDQITSIFSKPKPLDVFDLSWYAARSAGAHAMEDEDDVRLVMVMVNSVSDAKKMAKGGLRRVAQARRGRVRVVLSRDRDTWRRFGVDESRLPAMLTYDPNRDKIRHYGRIKPSDAARAVGELIDGIVSKRTHTASVDLNDPARNYSGGFHRVSWSPHLYVMDGFLSPSECESMIKNAYPTLSTGSLVGDNINKKIKDLRFTVVPADRFTRVEHDVVDRIHDHIRISEPHGEILQVSEYLPGQKYTLHPDSIGSSPGPHSMQRIVTVLMYLNDVDEGGHTVFPRANGQNQHITRHDTEPWNLEYICNLEDSFKVAPKAGRAIFWYNHHTDLSWDQNTIHGACHVTQGIKYVAQRWIRWHTTETDGHNPLQRALDEKWHLGRQLDEARRIAQSSGELFEKEQLSITSAMCFVICIFLQSFSWEADTASFFRLACGAASLPFSLSLSLSHTLPVPRCGGDKSTHEQSAVY
jgi:prolyl 4-hydroxylase